MDNAEKLHGNIGYTRHKTKTNIIKNTTQYVLDTTIHKTKTNKIKNTTQYVVDTTIHKTKINNNNKHDTICDGHHHTQDEDKQQQQTRHNM